MGKVPVLGDDHHHMGQGEHKNRKRKQGKGISSLPGPAAKKGVCHKIGGHNQSNARQYGVYGYVQIHAFAAFTLFTMPVLFQFLKKKL